jgi:DNA-binding protein HU-beta
MYPAIQGNTMNKNDLIETFAARIGVSKTEADRILNTFVDIVTETLKKGDEVNIAGFGHFVVTNRSARAGVNPRNPSEKIHVAATRVPKFRAGKNLKEAVRGASGHSPSHNQ